MRVWVDGRVVDSSEVAPASGEACGNGHGDGLFETVKVVRGRPFALTRHLARLTGSAQALGLPDPDEGDVRRGVDAVLQGPALDLGRIRITFTVAPTGQACLTVSATAMAPVTGTAAVMLAAWPRDEHAALSGHKTTSYAGDILALAQARAAGADEAVFVNTAGNLCEGTTSNVFYVLDGELRTPSLASGCLPGVTRELVLEWYGGREVDEPFEELVRATEIILVSTTRNVQGVHRWDGSTLEAPGTKAWEVASVWAAREAENADP